MEVMVLRLSRFFAVVLLIAAAVACVSEQAGFVLDRSTPERAAKSFVELVNRGDPRQAAVCILGGSPSTMREGRLNAGAYLELTDVSVEVEGDKARLSGRLVLYDKKLADLTAGRRPWRAI